MTGNGLVLDFIWHEMQVQLELGHPPPALHEFPGLQGSPVVHRYCGGQPQRQLHGVSQML